MKWPIRSFGEVVINRDSQRIPLKQADRLQKQGDYPYYGASGIIDHVDEYLFDGEFLLIGEDGANLLARSSPIAFIARDKFWVNNHAHIVEATEYSDLKYLRYFFQTVDLKPYVTGSAQPKLNRKNLDRIPIPLPPLTEQKRIAAILDKADGVRRKRQEAIRLTEELLRARFLDMFGDPVTNPKGWDLKELGDILDFKTGKLDSNAAIEGGVYPFFTCSRVPFQIDSYAFDCEALLLAGNNANADYWVKHYSGKFNAYQRTYVLTTKNQDHSYTYFQKTLELRLNELKRSSKGTNTKYLTLAILKPIKVQIPPLSLQEKYEEFCQKIYSQVNQADKALNESENLFNSLLKRAFRGEL
ncbi:MAG: restriction endonuclease subunit S [Cyanobacteria bacterium P01_G01_bin.54]